jgi:hypothetical protein
MLPQGNVFLNCIGKVEGKAQAEGRKIRVGKKSLDLWDASLSAVRDYL